MFTEALRKGTGQRVRGRRNTMKSALLAIGAAIAATVAFSAPPAFAQASATNVGVFRDWNAFASNDAGGKICFVASQPTESKYSQTVSGRDPAFFQITSVPSKNVRNEASTIVGFTIRTSADVVVDVDGTQFRMFLDASHPDTAWAVPEQEAALIEAMKKGRRMVVQSTSGRGTQVSDTYSLSGITAALEKLGQECP
jgi:invasion protein IalB